jgi:hypothetical protein
LNPIEPLKLCLTLHSLNLGPCVINNLFDILSYLPNLNYLEIILLSNGETIDQSSIKHNKISHLKVKLRNLDPDLQILLKSMTNLSRLEFLWNGVYQRYSLQNDFDFKTFSDILENHSASLKRIDIDIHVSKCYYDINSIHLLNLQWFSSLSKIEIFNDPSILITTKKFSSNSEKEKITTLLQSIYMTQSNARFHRIK